MDGMWCRVRPAGFWGESVLCVGCLGPSAGHALVGIALPSDSSTAGCL